MKKILAIGAHFDDVDLAVGGTLNKLSKDCDVFKITLTDNITMSKNLNINVKYKSSKNSSLKSSKVLGVKEIKNKMIKKCTELKYDKYLMQYIEDIIFQKKIDTVFLHFDNDLNQDHIAASEISKTAARHCKNILMYQSNFYLSSKQFQPNYFIDISSNVLKKKKALACYDKAHDRNNKLFDLTIKRNQVWGNHIGVDYAEGFMLIKYLYE